MRKRKVEQPQFIIIVIIIYKKILNETNITLLMQAYRKEKRRSIYYNRKFSILHQCQSTCSFCSLIETYKEYNEEMKRDRIKE